MHTRFLWTALAVAGLASGEAPAPEAAASVKAKTQSPASPEPAPEPKTSGRVKETTGEMMISMPTRYAEASSYLQDKGNRHITNYHPYFAIDTRLSTGWVEGVPGPGIGEHFTVALETAKAARNLRVELENGYQKSDRLLLDNGAPAELRVEVLHKGKVVAETTGTVRKRRGWEQIPLAFDTPTDFDAVRLTILAVHAGEKYDDTVITQVRIVSDGRWKVDGKATEEVEQWFDTRKKVAKGHAPDPMHGLWFSHFDSAPTHPEPSELEAQLAPVRAAQAKLVSAQWYEVPAGDAPLKPVPDFLGRYSLRAPEGYPIGTSWTLKRLFTADYSAAKPVDTALAQTEETVESEEEGWGSVEHTSHLRIAWHGPGVPAVVLERQSGESCRSACSTSAMDRMVVFDPEGQPVLVYEEGESTLEGDVALKPDADGWPALTWASEAAKDGGMEYSRTWTLTRFATHHGRIASAERWQRAVTREDGQTDDTVQGWRYMGLR